MFISRQHKIIVIWNPKTGSQSIHRYLRLNVPDAYFGPAGRDEPEGKAHWHIPLFKIMKENQITAEEIITYRIATFWRDPIDRFLSGYAWKQREFPDLYANMSIREYVETEQYFRLQKVYLADRIHSFDEPRFPLINFDSIWTWFNFHDYENEFRRLAGWFGLTPGEQAPPKYPTQGNEIPWAQYSNNRLQVEDLTEEEIRLIKEVHREDYELLESRGIFAPTRDL
jgi:hypothetical protein